jgi:hypothetical protein
MRQGARGTTFKTLAFFSLFGYISAGEEPAVRVFALNP